MCGLFGHTIDRCFKPGGGIAVQYPDWWKKKSRPANSPTGGTPTQTASQLSANIAVVSQSPSVAHSGSSGECYAFMTQSQTQGSAAGASLVITYANSAATEHCFTDIADFVTYETHKGNGKMATKGRAIHHPRNREGS